MTVNDLSHPDYLEISPQFIHRAVQEQGDQDAFEKLYLHLAALHAGKFNLLITDIVMPEMNGRELAEQIAAIQPGIQRLYVSGYPADFVAHRGVLEAGVHFLQKPFTLQELAAKVQEVLA